MPLPNRLLPARFPPGAWHWPTLALPTIELHPIVVYPGPLVAALQATHIAPCWFAMRCVDYPVAAHCSGWIRVAGQSLPVPYGYARQSRRTAVLTAVPVAPKCRLHFAGSDNPGRFFHCSVYPIAVGTARCARRDDLNACVPLRHFWQAPRRFH